MFCIFDIFLSMEDIVKQIYKAALFNWTEER